MAVAPDVWQRAQHSRAPMVGRQREQRRLLDAFHHGVADRSCQLLTVLGAAGVGKSRLVAEVLKTHRRRGDRRGWPLPALRRRADRGPLVEALGAGGLLEQAAADDDAATARAAELLKPAGDPVAPEEPPGRCARSSRPRPRRPRSWSSMTSSGTSRPSSISSSTWPPGPATRRCSAHHGPPRAARRALRVGQRQAQRDDRAAPASARDRRPRPPAQAHRAGLLDDHMLRDPRRAEGNPLFVDEIVAMLIDDDILGAGRGDGPAWTAGRARRSADDPGTDRRPLDRLAEGDRAVIEAASIEARSCPRTCRGTGRSRSQPSRSMSTYGRSCARTSIRPVGATEDSFRFRHQLIRDGAYDGMPKQLRADLHERFADRLSGGHPPSRSPTSCSATISSARSAQARARRDARLPP